MSTSPARRNGRGTEYDGPTKAAALMELALAGGSATQAARRLRERGSPVHKQTLQRWKDSPEYAQIRDGQALQVQKEIAREHEDLAIQAAGVTRKLLARLDKESAEIPVRDLAGAARNTGTIGGIAVDKTMAARERPLPRAERQRDIQEIVRALVALGVVREIEPGALVIDATAIEDATSL